MPPVAQNQFRPSAKVIRSRGRRACDTCHARKIKCDERMPCAGCMQINVPCTNDRSKIRRGPVNRHAALALQQQQQQQQQQQKQEQEQSPTSSPSASKHQPSPIVVTSTPLNLSSILNPLPLPIPIISRSPSIALGIELICPLPTLHLLLNSFFTSIHPLIPIVHHPTFLSRLSLRHDLTHPPFLASIASLLAALIASYPRKFLSYGLPKLYPSSMAMAEYCHEIAITARGVHHQDVITVESAATSYALFLSSGYLFNNRTRMRLLMAESFCAIRILRLHVAETYAATNTLLDCVEKEVGKRVYWCNFNTVRTMQQFQNMDDVLVPPETGIYPPLPLEVDDEYIFPDHIDAQPPGIVSKLTGFVANTRLYLSFARIPLLEASFGFNGADLEKLKEVLEEVMEEVKGGVEGLSEVLAIKGGETAQEEGVVQIKYEVQKANIYTTHICTRSFLMEKYLRVLNGIRRRKRASFLKEQNGTEGPNLEACFDDEVSFEDVPAVIALERDEIVKELLDVLSHICQAGMEPNGRAVIAKIRRVATTILPPTGLSEKSFNTYPKEYLLRVFEVLSKLEQIDDEIYDHDGDNNGNVMRGGDENGIHGEGNGTQMHVDRMEEIRMGNECESVTKQRWAELRERQVRFIEQVGGFI